MAGLTDEQRDELLEELKEAGPKKEAAKEKPATEEEKPKTT